MAAEDGMEDGPKVEWVSEFLEFFFKDRCLALHFFFNLIAGKYIFELGRV